MTAFALPEPNTATIRQMQVTVPRIAPDELLVQIKAIGVGVHDAYFLPEDMSFPYPIGIEAAGIITQVGHAVRKYQQGDHIAFVSTMQPKGGVWAEYAAVNSTGLIIEIPTGMSFEQAAAIPVAGNTTLRAFASLPDLPAGSSIFVAGGSGAIGTFAIQLAKARGWHISASASRKNHDYLHRMGAELTVDYQDTAWPEQVRQWQPYGVDGAIAIQPQTTTLTASVVKPSGTVVTVSGDQDQPAGITVTGLAYQIDVRNDLQMLMESIADGTIQLVIERTYPFREAQSALAKTQTRHARGKTVITLEP